MASLQEVTHINPEAARRSNFHLKSKATSALKVNQVTPLVPETRVKIREERDFADRKAIIIQHCLLVLSHHPVGLKVILTWI